METVLLQMITMKGFHNTPFPKITSIQSVYLPISYKIFYHMMIQVSFGNILQEYFCILKNSNYDNEVHS